MNETLPSRKVDKKVALTSVVMQRLHQNDPTGNRLDKGIKGGKVRHICLPADINEGYEIKPRYLRRHYKNGLMDSIRLGRDVLAEQRTLLGEFGYAGQYGQSPVPLGGGQFKVDRIRIERSAPLKFRQRCRFWDKAGTAGGGAYTVGALLGVDLDGVFWILDIVRGQWDSSEREKIIRQTAIADRRIVVVGLEQEPGSGGKESAEATVRNLAGFRVRLDKPTGSKEDRADPFSTQVNGWNVRCIKAPWTTACIEELRFFPASRYKDQVDALSGGFNIISKRRMKAGAL
jgi:predicted phage terminase large subunit-like protein